MLPLSERFWALNLESLYQILQSGETGLSVSVAESVRSAVGVNKLPEPASTGLLRTLAQQFASPLIGILVFAALATAYLHEYIEAAVIVLAVVVNVLLSTYQEYSAEKTIAALRQYVRATASVVRDGVELSIPAEEIVPGDVVVTRYGEKIVADARIIESSDATADESILTGESLPVRKRAGIIESNMVSDRSNTLFAGTLLVTGVARSLVVRTGSSTELGKIAASIAGTDKAATPVQNAVRAASWYIFGIALIIVSAIFVLGVQRGEAVLDMLVLSSAVAVGAVPEALPIALTVILAIGVARIAGRGGLVNKLEAAETLGSTTLILTDKTGTLTTGKLSLERIIGCVEIFDDAVEATQGAGEGEPLLALAYTNIEAFVVSGGDSVGPTYSGNPLEVALLRAIHERGIEDTRLRKGESVRPFNSAHKYSASYDGTQTVFLGAPDILADASRLREEDRVALRAFIAAQSDDGKRLVALATRHGRRDEPTDAEFLGIFVFSDTIRDSVAASIARIRESGVGVKVISGDLPGTVRHVAACVGIKAEEDQILTGARIAQMNDEDLRALLPQIMLFARVTPADKLRIGRLYQSLGEMVAMTGDGVNDAPALKAMHIGIALGSGTDVAKGAADLVLLENSFTTIADSVYEGRVIKANIRKVFVYLMSNSLDMVFVITGALLAGISLPLTALQIIWVNMVTGTLPALAFAYDTHAVGSNRLKDPIFDTPTRVLALGIGALSSFFLFLLYLALERTIADTDIMRSVFFACLSTYILAIAYSFVHLEKTILQYAPLSNWRLNVANGIGLFLIAATIYTPLGQAVFGLVAVPLAYLPIVAAWCLANILLVELAKRSMQQMRGILSA